MTPTRAKEILHAGRMWGNFSQHCTETENLEVHAVWNTMPGTTSWYDALLRISRGLADNQHDSPHDKLARATRELLRVCSNETHGGELKQLSTVRGRVDWYTKMRVARETARQALADYETHREETER